MLKHQLEQKPGDDMLVTQLKAYEDKVAEMEGHVESTQAAITQMNESKAQIDNFIKEFVVEGKKKIEMIEE